MPNRKYLKGYRHEAGFVKKLLSSGEAIKAQRFHASKGVTDVWWVDMDGVHNEAQLKYSKGRPYISPKEMNNLLDFAKKVDGLIKVWIVTKQAYRKQVMTLVK